MADQDVMDFKDLLDQAGIDAPVIENTGEAFEFYKHCVGEYEGLVGKYTLEYINGENKKVEKGTPGAKMRDFGLLGLIITKSPDNHGFAPDFNIKDGQVYGEFIHNQFVTQLGDRQWQNKNLFDTFKIAGAPTTDVIIDGKSGQKTDFRFDPNSLGFYIGAPISWEMVEYTNPKTGKKSINLTNLTLKNNLLSKAIFEKRKALVDGIYSKLEALLKKEDEERKSKKAKSEDDKALSGIGSSSATGEMEDIMNKEGFDPTKYE